MTRSDGEGEPREIAIGGRHVPAPVKGFDYWTLWDFQEKQPRAPWETGHCYKTKWRQDGNVNPRTDYDSAAAAAALGPSELHKYYPFPDDPPEKVGPTLLLPHEGADTPGPGLADPPLLFVDYDDVLDKESNEIPREVWDTIVAVGGPLFVSRSYFDSEEVTAGLHQLARGTLPGGVTTVEAPFDSRGHVEVYYRSRMTGFTWEHVRGTPTDDLPDATDAIVEIIDRYAKPTTQQRASVDPEETSNLVGPDPQSSVERTPPEDLADLDSTENIKHVFDAISHVGPEDIRLRSARTEKGNGTRLSYDPSWTDSESGTRLGYDTLSGDETWIYRAGSRPVDALQVVAREEGITTDVTRYPQGEAFWKAVAALRNRGASIPYYEGKDGTHPDVLRLHEEPEDTEDQRRQALRAMRASNRTR